MISDIEGRAVQEAFVELLLCAFYIYFYSSLSFSSLKEHPSVSQNWLEQCSGPFPGYTLLQPEEKDAVSASKKDFCGSLRLLVSKHGGLWRQMVAGVDEKRNSFYAHRAQQGYLWIEEILCIIQRVLFSRFYKACTSNRPESYTTRGNDDG